MARLEEWLPRASRFRTLRVHRIRLIGLLCHLTKNAGVFWTPAFSLVGPESLSRGFETAPCSLPLSVPARSAQFATMSNEWVSSAVFAIMIDAEQYLSCDRLIARSTVAGFRFLPVTVK